MSKSINDILAERGARYGAFQGNAEISQHLKATIRRYLDKREKHLTDDQLEALEMICHKLARIINGDPAYSDSWRDIGGFAVLVADRLDGVVR
jgi:hypothetical protein